MAAGELDIAERTVTRKKIIIFTPYRMKSDENLNSAKNRENTCTGIIIFISALE